MTSWKDIVQNYIIKHSSKIQKTTRPLRENFGIEYFTYHRIDNTGKYTTLLDRPDWAEHYVSEEFFKSDPYLRHPSVYESGLCLMENHGSLEYRERVLGSGNKFNLDMGAILIQRSNSAVEFFGICTRERASLQKLCLNHPQILKSFATYFKKEMRSILAKMESEASSLIDLKGEDFYCKDPICPDVASGQRLSFFKGIGCDVERLENLSQREKECLKLLVDGKTAKETASLLGLSRRTVESYFENIKNKLSCQNKQEVFHLGKTFEGMGLL